MTGRTIGAEHVETLKKALSKNAKDKEDLTHEQLMRTLLTFDPTLSDKMDKQAALIGGGMMKQYLGQPGMLLDKIASALKELVPGFASFIDSAMAFVKPMVERVAGFFDRSGSGGGQPDQTQVAGVPAAPAAADQPPAAAPPPTPPSA